MERVEELRAWVVDARERTFAMVADLEGDRWVWPRGAHLNPPLWELGHLAWFQERWVLRHVAGQQPGVREADLLFDSARVPHGARWDFPLTRRAEVLGYLRSVAERVLEVLHRGEPSRELTYFTAYSVFHEDMHQEAMLQSRQGLALPAPVLTAAREPALSAPDPVCGAVAGDVEIPGGSFPLGAPPSEPFVFDNEKWQHEVRLEPFRIARAATTQAEFAAFVEDGGYRRESWWDEPGRAWLARGARAPLYWRGSPGKWQRRHFDRWVDLEPDLPIMNLNRHEAAAWARWAGRRLPSEAEWEAAACAELDSRGLHGKRRFPWGDSAPEPARARLEARPSGCAGVGSLALGDSPAGCRQMIGNVWEWTASDFAPYPGFERDPYAEYSEPWFGDHAVLRGGSWATRARLLRATYRNFYTPDRRDVWAGFRTCA